jgi:hypothetical protein
MNNLIKKFKLSNLKENIKKFNYFENNIIFILFSLLGLAKSSNLGLTSKRYNKLFKKYPFSNIINISGWNGKRYYIHPLTINIFPNIKFRSLIKFSGLLSNSTNNFTNLDILKYNNIYELFCSNIRNTILPEMNITTLVMRCKYLVKLPIIKNLVNLELLNCKITDYSALKNMTNLVNLRLNECDIINTNGLENIRNIIFHKCDKLIDISNLNNCNTVYLFNCSIIVNIDSLNTVNKVAIDSCDLIPESTLNKYDNVSLYRIERSSYLGFYLKNVECNEKIFIQCRYSNLNYYGYYGYCRLNKEYSIFN